MNIDPGPNDPNRGSYPAHPNYGPQSPSSPSQAQYRFSKEELRVLRQCNHDSFFQRCIPIASILGISTYYGVRMGYLKPHARWGAIPKVTLAAFVGYFVGKISYQGKCSEMIMRIPNSQLAEALRQRKHRGGFQETITMDPGLSLPSFGAVETYSDVGPHPEIDMDRPYQEGLDDSFRPTLDSPLSEDDNRPVGTQQRSATYEELRRKNREEYELKRTKQFRGVTGTEDIPTAIRPRGPSPDVPPSPPPTWNREKNQYGDVWEK